MGVNEILAQQSAAIRKLAQRVGVAAQLGQAAAAIAAWLTDQPPSITDEIDRIPGRRVFTTLADEVDFDATNQGKQGEPLTFQVSQDGPFIMTHYPMAIWRVTEPDNADTFLMWRPVSNWPLPTQVESTETLDLGYRFFDGGSERFFDNAAVGPLFSRPDNLIPLPVPTHFATSSLISIYPQYWRVNFNGETHAATKGALHIDLPGYRIVNL